MNRLILILTLTISVLLGSSGVCWSADFQKGLDAYQRGDYATALKEWTPLAKRGNTAAQFNLGQMYHKGYGVPQDDKTAVKWFKLGAEQGDAGAQTKLGFMYRDGLGVSQNYKTAMKWFALAAEQGDADAYYFLGNMYFLGEGVLEDYTRAHMWLNISASTGREDVAELRGIVAQMMTPQQIAEAQKLARECVAKNYKGC